MPGKARGLLVAGFLLLGAGLWAGQASWMPGGDVNLGDMERALGAAPAPETSTAAGASEVEGLSASGGISGAEKALVESNNLQIGGTLSSEADQTFLEGSTPDHFTFSNPNAAFLYLDSRLQQDVRVFARAELFEDPTGLTSSQTYGLPFGLTGTASPQGLSAPASDNASVSLQELKLMTDFGRKVFLTLGRQKVKYGAAAFFNPTDFLNAQGNDFFLPADVRPGVDMLKAQVPVGADNFYLAGLLDGATNGDRVGAYARAEIAYPGLGDLVGAGETSFSALARKDAPSKVGFDLSQALLDLDAYFEGAFFPNPAWGQPNQSRFLGGYSTGFSYEWRYADRDTNTLNLQAEFAQAGAAYEYGVLALALPQPGMLKDITFSSTNLYSFMDQSGLSRLDAVYQFTPDLSGRIYGQAHWGVVGGVFRQPTQLAELGARYDVSF